MSLPLPRIAGILNLTADSFSDGGKYTDTAAAVRHGMAMLENGADLLDIGAESTRPGATEIPAETEIDALLPVITELKRNLPDCVLSIDTRKAVVADAVLKCGADIINDVSGLLFDPAMADAVAQYPAAGLVLMHSRGTPETMQQEQNLIYRDLIGEINGFFAEQTCKAEAAGINRKQIMLDPGIGFAKTAEQNFELIRQLDAFRIHGLPLWYGVSRKSFLGGNDPAARDFSTAGVLAVLTLKQADILRVHNTAAARDVIRAAAQCGGGK